MWKQNGFSSIVILVMIIIFGLIIIEAAQNANTKSEVTAPDVSDAEHTEKVKSSKVYYSSNSDSNYEIYETDLTFNEHKQITKDSAYDSWWPRISPDNTKLLFYRTPAGTHDRDYSKTELWVTDLSNGETKQLLNKNSYGWALHGHAEWSPDGKYLTMFGGKQGNPQIFITNNEGQNPQQITNEGGQNLDPSWHPDGEKIVYVGCPKRICFQYNQEIYEIDLSTLIRTRLTQDDIRDNDPYYSPDGSKIAFLSQTAAANGSKIVGEWNTRLIKNGNVTQLTDYANVLSLPTWKDENTIITHGLTYGSGKGFDIFKITLDSSEIENIYSSHKDQEYISF